MSRSQLTTFTLLGLIVVLQIANLSALRSLRRTPTGLPISNLQYPISNPPTPVPTSPSAVQDELTQIHAELRSLNQVLGVSKSTPDLSNILIDPTPTPAVSQLTTSVTINVYQDPSVSSRPLDQKLNPGQNYPYTSYKDSWYQVILPNGSSGWVSSAYIKRL